MAKQINTRVINKNDTLENWRKATGFVPMKGEVLVVTDTTPPSVMIGDGVTAASALPLSTMQADWNEQNNISAGYIINKPFYTTSSERKTIVENLTINTFAKDGDNDWYTCSNNPFVISATEEENKFFGSKYLIIFDGVEYVCYYEDHQKIWYKEDGAYDAVVAWYSVGNPSIISSSYTKNDRTIPVCITQDFTRNNNEIKVYTTENGTSHIISIYELIEEVKTIDWEYLPLDPTQVFVPGNNEGDGSIVSRWAASASGAGALSSGFFTKADAQGAHAEGTASVANGIAAHAEGQLTTASGNAAHSEGYANFASGLTAHVEGYVTEASGAYSHAEGYYAKATNAISHAEGQQTESTAQASHSEGWLSKASGQASHAEGYDTKATNSGAHAEGWSTQATGQAAHAEGYGAIASGNAAHAAGNTTQAIGNYSYAGGSKCIANKGQSFAHGLGLNATKASQAVFGKYNAQNDDAIFIVGVGSADALKNAFTVMADATDPAIKIGETVITESQLQQLLALLNIQNAEEAEF